MLCLGIYWCYILMLNLHNRPPPFNHHISQHNNPLTQNMNSRTMSLPHTLEYNTNKYLNITLHTYKSW